MNSVLCEIRYIIIGSIFCITELLKLPFYSSHTNCNLMIILQVVSDLLFIICLSDFIQTLILRTLEQCVRASIKKIFNYNIYFYFLLLLIFGLYFFLGYHTYLYLTHNLADNVFININICSLSTVICFLSLKETGEIFYLNNTLIISHRMKFYLIQGFSFYDSYLIVKTENGKELKIKTRKDVERKDIIDFFTFYQISQIN